MSRADEIAALPTFGELTRLMPVKHQKVLIISPLRSGDAKDAYFTEVAPAADVMRCVSIGYGAVQRALGGNPAKPFGDVVPAGRSGFTACKTAGKYTGLYSLRVDKAEANNVMAKLTSDWVVEGWPAAKPTDCVLVPVALHSAAVLERIRVQMGVNGSTTKFDRSLGRDTRVYTFTLDQAGRDRANAAGGLDCGAAGKFPIYVYELKPTTEMLYVYGATGVGSAELDVQPAIAGSLGVSEDETPITRVFDGVKASSVIVALQYPFSITTYDAVTEICSQEQFKIENPRKPGSKPLQVYVAPTLAELQAIVPVQFLKKVITVADEDDEEAEAVDLTPLPAPAGSAGP